MSQKKTANKAKRPKKINKNFYLASPKVRELEKNRKALESERKDLLFEVTEIVELYKQNAEKANLSYSSLDRLPLESLKDIQDLKAKKLVTILGLMRSQSELKDDREVVADDLKEYNQLIALNKIDLLLAKIDFVVSKIPNNESEEK